MALNSIEKKINGLKEEIADIDKRLEYLWSLFNSGDKREIEIISDIHDLTILKSRYLAEIERLKNIYSKYVESGCCMLKRTDDIDILIKIKTDGSISGHIL